MTQKPGCTHCYSPFLYVLEEAETRYQINLRYIHNIANCVTTKQKGTHESPVCSWQQHPYYARVEAMMSLLGINSMTVANIMRCYFARKAMSTSNSEARQRYLNEMEASSGLYLDRTRLDEPYVPQRTCLHTYMSPLVEVRHYPWSNSSCIA